MSKLEYNTLGKGTPFDELTDFINTLREPENQQEKIKRDVQHLVHDINNETFQLYCLRTDNRIYSNKLITPDYRTRFFCRLKSLLYTDFRKRIEDRPWRHALKCKVVACLNKRFEILK